MNNYNTPENNKTVTKTRRIVTKKITSVIYQTSLGDFSWDDESGELDLAELPNELTTSDILDLIAIFKEILKDLEVKELDK